MATAPVKSQPLHNFSLPFLKWGGKSHTNSTTRCRRTVSPASSEPDSDYHHDSDPPSRVGSRSARNRFGFSPCSFNNNNNNNNSNNNQIAQSSPYPLQPTPPPPPPPSSATPFHHLLQQQQQQLQMFWSYQRQEIEQVNDFKNHQLPLARIKKIMKADEDVRMISAEAPILFAKACELFILELTIRSWLHAEENKRRTLQKNDIAAAITRTDIFDFLVDIVPRDEIKDEAAGLVGGIVGATASGVPYYYPPMGQPAGGPHGGMMIGRPAPVDPTGGVYVQPPSNAWQSVWQGHAAADDGSYGSGASSGHGNLDGQS